MSSGSPPSAAHILDIVLFRHVNANNYLNYVWMFCGFSVELGRRLSANCDRPLGTLLDELSNDLSCEDGAIAGIKGNTSRNAHINELSHANSTGVHRIQWYELGLILWCLPLSQAPDLRL